MLKSLFNNADSLQPVTLFKKRLLYMNISVSFEKKKKIKIPYLGQHLRATVSEIWPFMSFELNYSSTSFKWYESEKRGQFATSEENCC